MLMYMYLPIQMILENINDMEFEEFFALYAKAEVARELKIEDVEIGVNKGYVEAHSEGDG